MSILRVTNKKAAAISPPKVAPPLSSEKQKTPAITQAMNYTPSTFDRLLNAARTMSPEVDATKKRNADDCNMPHWQARDLCEEMLIPSDKSDDYKKAATYEKEISSFLKLKTGSDENISRRVHGLFEEEQKQTNAKSSIDQLNAIKQELDKRGYFQSPLGVKEKGALFTDCADETKPCQLIDDVKASLTEKQLDTNTASSAEIADSYIEARARTDWKAGLAHEKADEAQEIDWRTGLAYKDDEERGIRVTMRAAPFEQVVTQGSDENVYLKNLTKSILNNFKNDAAVFDKIKNRLKDDVSIPEKAYDESHGEKGGRDYSCRGSDGQYPLRGELYSAMYPDWASYPTAVKWVIVGFDSGAVERADIATQNLCTSYLQQRKERLGAVVDEAAQELTAEPKSNASEMGAI